MKIGKYLFAITNYEKWNVCLQNMNYEIFVKIHELWKKLNVCSQCMNYEDIFAIHELLK